MRIIETTTPQIRSKLRNIIRRSIKNNNLDNASLEELKQSTNFTKAVIADSKLHNNYWYEKNRNSPQKFLKLIEIKHPELLI